MTAETRWPTLPIPEELGMSSCKELESTPELFRFAESSLWEAWDSLVRVGSDGVPWLSTADVSLLPPRLQLASNTAPLLCQSVHQDTPGSTFLLVPLIAKLLPEMKTAEAGRGLSRPPGDEMKLWPGQDRGPLLNQLQSSDLQGPGQIRRPPQLNLKPIGAGSLIRLAPPTFGAHLGILWQGKQEGPAQPNPLSATVLEDPLDYRFRLPTGTVRVLIIKF